MAKDRSKKTVFGVGYIGIGKYTVLDKNGNKTKHYKKWYSMFVRCYDKKNRNKNITYFNCEVCEEWHNFQVFAQWFDENYYTIDNEKTELDKDILSKGNKVYSPNTCVFVSKRINALFTKSNKTRGKYPIGVSHRKDNSKFTSYCNRSGEKRKNLGQYNTPEEAFEVYKEYKEKYIKEVADEYQDRIPQQLYDALYNYKVEITD